LFSSSEDIRSASLRPRSWQASHAPPHMMTPTENHRILMKALFTGVRGIEILGS
jgi:hypothetical protein